jgi:pyroglutamyl-peptidase
MLRIFVTAFEAYDEWPDNASWLALVEFTKDLPGGARITTRRYPVDFQAVRQRLESDLSEDYDYALHLGQAPGSAKIRLETIGINVGGRAELGPESFQPLVADGPTAYRTGLPVSEWASMLHQAGLPATVSYYAGTYLCNATLYLTHHIAARQRLRTKATFVHVPLDVSRSAQRSQELASLPASISAAALRLIIEDLVKRGQPDAASLA